MKMLSIIFQVTCELMTRSRKNRDLEAGVIHSHRNFLCAVGLIIGKLSTPEMMATAAETTSLLK